MKKILFTISLCGIVLFAGHSAFAQTVGQCPANYTLIQCGYYQEAYQDGVSDAQSNRDSDHKRYKNKLDGSKYQTYYQDGYEAGYSSIRPNRRWDREGRNAYNNGFQKGDNDKRQNISRSPERYSSSYNQNSENEFKRGYYDGYDGRPRQNGNNDRPFDPNNPSFPNNSGYPTNYGKAGTATGTVSWSGSVDDRTNITIQGDQITEQIVSGNGSYTNNKSINGVLPRAAAMVTVYKQGGRGDATVIQQPNRNNNYTAIIQVADTKRGADNYNLQISWQATEPLEEAYQSGRVSWKGRVDQTANIVISGNTVQTQDASGSGVFVTSSNITGYLARRPGTVSVNKQKGRGSVIVLQQPTAENGYVAIVQITDTERSTGDYEIEVSW